MKKKLINIVMAIMLSIGLFIDLSLFKELKDIDYTIFYNINTFGMALSMGLLYVLYSKKDKDISKSKKFLAFILGLFMILGEAYASYGSFKIITCNIAAFLIALFKLLGFTYLFINLFYWLDKAIIKIKNNDIKFKNKYLSKYLNLFDKYPFRTSLVTILIVIGIYVIAFYPIVLSPDPSFQIKMYFNEHTKYIDWVIQRDPNINMTAHHPVLQTYLIGWSISLGRMFVNDNFGLFIYTFFQSLIYASVLAYTIKFAKNNGVKNKFLLILLGMYTLVPMYALYSVSAVKDTLYTAFMILFTLKIFELVKDSTKVLSIKEMSVLYFIMLLIGLFRHNGVYVIFLTVLFICFYSRRNWLKILVVFILFFGSIYTFDNVIVPSFGISDGSVREMLSVPFQQTARLVKEYPDFYQGKDKEVIDYILDYDTLGSRYNPNLADAVKNKYNKYTTNDDLVNYFNAWWKGLVKHFDVYLDATLNNTYGYFYPNAHNWYTYTEFDNKVTKNNLVDYHFNKCGFLRNIINVYANVFPYIPVIGLLSNIGFNTWVVLILSVYLISSKNKKYLISLMPLYGSILFCIIGPANTYFRYTMPYVFCLPVLMMVIFVSIKEDKKRK